MTLAHAVHQALKKDSMKQSVSTDGGGRRIPDQLDRKASSESIDVSQFKPFV